MPRVFRPHGEMRQGQLITTFGPGAMLDLPKHSVLIGGLEDWRWSAEEPERLIEEPRLQRKIAWLLGRDHILLKAPPALSSRIGAGPSGVTVWQFPEWFVTTKTLPPPSESRHRWRRLVHRRALDRSGRLPNPDTPGSKREMLDVVPIRFVRACVRGHIDDIDWKGFVHQAARACPPDHLWIEDQGTSGDLSDSYVACEACNARQPLIALVRATEQKDPSTPTPLGFCNGRMPWLGRGVDEKCGGPDRNAQPFKLLIRSASNAYFPQLLSVIHVPDLDSALRAAVDRYWDRHLCFVENAQDLASASKNPALALALRGFTPEEVLAEIAQRRSDRAERGAPIKPTELQAFLRSPDSVGEDRPDGDFFARTLHAPARATGPMSKIERIVLVHRLREVVAQVGFSRFEPLTPDTDGELPLAVERAPLAKEMQWVPATDHRGEGVLIVLEPEALESWAEREAVKRRAEELRRGFEMHLALFDDDVEVEFPGARYVMLHSLAHLLITTIALESGYAASAIRERIYCSPDVGYAILIYTGSSDSEGTLGGLVAVARRMDHLLRNALEMGRLCSNDPVCALHEPTNKYEERHLHGASCHGCLLIAETSCERFNQYLDRALVVSTVERHGAEFFSEEDLA